MSRFLFFYLFVIHYSLLAMKSSLYQSSSLPHIIVVMVDDLGWNGMSFRSNNSEVVSPNIDSLAKNGIILDNYYVYKFCSPTRASFLTGRIPGHGIWEKNPPATSAIGVNQDIKMLPAMLKPAGYKTAQIGKWHMGYYRPFFTPHGRGFDTSFGFLHGGEDHFNQCGGCANAIPDPDWANHSRACPAKHSPCKVECPLQGGVDLYRTTHPAVGENGTYNAFNFAAEAQRVIKNHAKEKSVQPLFMFLALHNVHQPVEAPPDFLNLYPKSNYNKSTMPRRVYNAMHSAVDEVVKNVTLALRTAGMWQNTVFVLTTDNGGTYEHNGVVPGSSNFPLRGHKYSYFEGGTRGTAFITSPLLPSSLAGTRNKGLMHVSDWYPTFCYLANVSSDDGFKAAPHDGVNIWPMLLNMTVDRVRPASNWVSTGGPKEGELILGIGQGKTGAFHNGSYKLIVGSQASHTDGWSAQYPGSTAKIPPPAKLACQEAPCLFNVVVDRREIHNLAGDMPELAAGMFQRYQELAKKMDVPNDWFDKEHMVPNHSLNEINEITACDKMKETGFWQPWKAD